MVEIEITEKEKKIAIFSMCYIFYGQKVVTGPDQNLRELNMNVISHLTFLC